MSTIVTGEFPNDLKIVAARNNFDRYSDRDGPAPIPASTVTQTVTSVVWVTVTEYADSDLNQIEPTVEEEEDDGDDEETVIAEADVDANINVANEESAIPDSPVTPPSQGDTDLIDSEPAAEDESESSDLITSESDDLVSGVSNLTTEKVEEVPDGSSVARRPPIDRSPYQKTWTTRDFETVKSYEKLLENKMNLRDQLCPICMASVPFLDRTFDKEQKTRMENVFSNRLIKWRRFENIRRKLVSFYGFN